MITNASMTLYHRKLNLETGHSEYVRYFIPDIYWYTDQKIVVQEKGVQSADVYKIRIPKEELTGYVSPQQYRNLTESEKEYYWTVENQDIFVKGECELETICSSADLEKKGYVFGIVNSWSDNRFGGIPHLRIGGAA